MKHRIFVVEDNPLMRESLLMYLELMPGFESCGAAEDAEAALAQIPTVQVDLVLVDVMLPGIDGIELVRRLRARQPGLRCLMLSGHAREHYEEAALAAGAVGYVMKDDADAIIVAIQQALKSPSNGPGERGRS